MTTAIFLPGILMPAPLRYARLFEVLQPRTDVTLLTKELAIYEHDTTPPPNYTLNSELDAVDRFAAEHDLERFHLYGHSGGGAVALAYTARNPDRVLSLALDEAATDFSEQDLATIREENTDQDVGGFVATLVRPDVTIPPPPAEPPPWMANRPQGIAAFVRALEEAGVQKQTFDGPVLYTYGDLSNPRWVTMATDLAAVFPNYEAVLFEGLHHLNTSHIAEPERVADLLIKHWANAKP
jgi:pimeloyl-ACP methyl ester carboxylesterase